VKLTSYGAAQEVTGSKHLLEIKSQRILLDFGMFQGRRKEADKKNRDILIDPKSIDTVILSHAHIDHSGLLPYLTRSGYNGRIYSTPATRDLCAVMLQDSAHIQERDVKWLAKKKHEAVQPLYSVENAQDIMNQFVCMPYRLSFVIGDGIRCTFYDAGHILGSAMVLLEWVEDEIEKSFLFSGDIGRKHLPILKDPDIPPKADWVLMESTYGDRDHENLDQMEEELEQVINETVQRGGKIIIPSFALERAQEIVYVLKRLELRNALPNIPIFVDSPLTVELTDIFRMNTECFDRHIRKDMAEGGDPFRPSGIKYIRDVEESIALNDRKQPCIIISASGMCEFGRIVHHIKNNCENKNNTILIVGFQAVNTLGRRIVERQPYIKVFGVEYPLNAKVETINAFSCHAGQSELIEFAQHFQGSAKEIFLVHGEEHAMTILQEKIRESGQKVTLLSQSETVILN
jgi:metallo-beta-lactamase family protein